jgi:hypothetical protein
MGDSSHTYATSKRGTEKQNKYDAFAMGSHAEKGFMSR